MSEQETKAPVEILPDPKRGLVVKLCEVTAAVGYLQKKGDNSSQGYKYVREADVVAAVRDEFAKRNLFIFPSLLTCERNKLSRVKYDKLIESYATDIVMEWAVVDGDTGQERKCNIPGCSESPGDKGVYVAMTGSEKYFLMKSLLLPTGDDPEEDANEPEGSKEAAKAVGEAKVAKFKAKAAQQASNGEAKATTNGASLFYALQPSGSYAVTGDVDLMRKLYKQFSKHFHEDKDGKFYMLGEEQLEVLKFQCEEGHIPLAVLRGPKA